MSCKHFYRLFFLSDGKAVKGVDSKEMLEDGDLLKLLIDCEASGVDGALVVDLAKEDKERETNISVLKNIKRAINIPVFAGGNIKRFEDAKKLIYAGCEKVLINLDDKDIFKALKEASKRFGKDKVIGFTNNVHIASGQYDKINDHEIDDLVGTVLFDPAVCVVPASVALKDAKLPTITIISEKELDNDLLANDMITGICGEFVTSLGDKVFEYKLKLKEEKNINVDIFESSVKWEDITTNKDGLIPVIVQDHKTDEVLMLAYFNEESFNLTLKSKRMTYYSRSRQSLWVKGETSGCYQYVKSLSIDCDNDTILAKVIQIGAACHTGNKSCFYRDLVNDNQPSTNPYKVFEDVYSVIMDRKENPKEGSYTNYLFDKGIDKILKKVGEEATEIVIAAKNPDAEEIKYEVADFLYHVMVLMAERGVTWDDITEELAKR